MLPIRYRDACQARQRIYPMTTESVQGPTGFRCEWCGSEGARLSALLHGTYQWGWPVCYKCLRQVMRALTTLGATIDALHLTPAEQLLSLRCLRWRFQSGRVFSYEDARQRPLGRVTTASRLLDHVGNLAQAIVQATTP